MNQKMKMAAWGLVATMLFGFSGCGGNETQNGGNGTPSESALMQKIKKSGKLVVGTSSGYPPYVFVDAQGDGKTVIGADIELARQIADKLGVKAEVQDMNFSALLSSVTAGKVDIAVGGVAPTAEREKAMAFSDIYLPTEQRLLIRKGDEGKYKSVADLKDASLGAEKSTTQDATAHKVSDKAVGLTNVPDAVLELKHGKLDGIILEGVVAKQYLVYNDDLTLSDITFDGAQKESAVALQKGNQDVVDIINQVIRENTDNGNFDQWVDEYSRIAVEKAQ